MNSESKVSLHPDHSHGDPRLDAAANTWGWHPMNWPRPYRQDPTFWQFAAKRRHKELLEIFGPYDRLAYYREREKGQGYDDAGGFMLRCYRAMIGLPPEEPSDAAD